MRLILTTLLFLAIRCSIFSQTSTPIWVRNEPADGTSMEGAPFARVDSMHNPIVCADDYHPGPLNSFLTTQYDAEGNLLWKKGYDTFGNDWVVACVVDHTNSVYVGGNTIQDLITHAIPRFIVIKYAPNGDTLWTYRFSGHNAGGSYISQLRLDAAQNLMVFGTYGDTIALKGGLFAAKIAPDGKELWSATYLDTIYSLSGRDARRVGDRWIVWGQNGGAAGYHFAAWQVDDLGQTLGSAVTGLYPGYNYETLFIDHEGALFIGASQKYKIDKYNLLGQKVLTYEKPLIPTNYSVPARVFCVEAGNNAEVYISGFVRTDSLGIQPIISKLNSSGDLIWEHSPAFPGPMQGIGIKFCWLSAEKLLIVGNYYTDFANNLKELFLAEYNGEGFVAGGTTDLPGENNLPTDVIKDGPYLYVSGYYDPILPADSKEQFLCKYALSDLVGIQNPIKPVNPLKVGPNPATEWVRVDMPSDCPGSMLLEMCDVNGKIVQRLPIKQGAQYIDVHLNGLSAGVYFLALRQNGLQTHAARIVKR